MHGRAPSKRASSHVSSAEPLESTRCVLGCVSVSESELGCPASCPQGDVIKPAPPDHPLMGALALDSHARKILQLKAAAADCEPPAARDTAYPGSRRRRRFPDRCDAVVPALPASQRGRGPPRRPTPAPSPPLRSTPAAAAAPPRWPACPSGWCRPCRACRPRRRCRPRTSRASTRSRRPRSRSARTTTSSGSTCWARRRPPRPPSPPSPSEHGHAHLRAHCVLSPRAAAQAPRALRWALRRGVGAALSPD